MSATQCLQHPWMAQRNATMSNVVLPTEKLKKFIVRRKWQKTGNAIRALGRMAMLSAYNRRSPTQTAESSPTLEKQFDLEIPSCADDTTIESTHPNVVENADRIETAAEENSVETEPQKSSTRFYSSLYVIQRNITPTDASLVKSELVLEPWREGEATADDSTQTLDHEAKSQNVDSITNEEESSTREGGSSDCSSERGVNAEEETNESTANLDILRDAGTRPQIITPEKRAQSDKERIERSPEVEQHKSVSPKSPQVLLRAHRGDSRDSGIGDCQMTSPLPTDESGVVSTIKEETDHESHGKRTSQREDSMKDQRSSSFGIPTSARGGRKSPLGDTGSSRSDDKVVTKSGVTTEASYAINLERKVAYESTDAGTLIGRTRDKFLPTGNVSRTARMFERESDAASRSDDSQMAAAQRAYPAAIVAGKPYNERIQKAFASLYRRSWSWTSCGDPAALPHWSRSDATIAGRRVIAIMSAPTRIGGCPSAGSVAARVFTCRSVARAKIVGPGGNNSGENPGSSPGEASRGEACPRERKPGLKADRL